MYADGKSDYYADDSSWRMTRFTDRDGQVTVLKYGADGSMTVVNPDGSTLTR
jgi:YD repeat-containing protein